MAKYPDLVISPDETTQELLDAVYEIGETLTDMEAEEILELLSTPLGSAILGLVVACSNITDAREGGTSEG